MKANSGLLATGFLKSTVPGCGHRRDSPNACIIRDCYAKHWWACRPGTRVGGRAMGNCLRGLAVLSGAVAKRRKFELLAASCLVPLSLGVSEPALAQTFGTGGNNYPGGINVSTNQTPINVTLDPG